MEHQAKLHTSTSLVQTDIPCMISGAAIDSGGTPTMGSRSTGEPSHGEDFWGESLSFQNSFSRQNSRASSFDSFTRLSPIASPRLTPLNSPFDRSEMQEIQSIAGGSRSGSVSSLQSERGRNRIMKNFRSSSASRHNPSTEDTVNAPRDLSFRSASSGGSVRSGPLTSMARMGMKAIKMIGGACWRCRILGKKVSSRIR